MVLGGYFLDKKFVKTEIFNGFSTTNKSLSFMKIFSIELNLIELLIFTPLTFFLSKSRTGTLKDDDLIDNDSIDNCFFKSSNVAEGKEFIISVKELSVTVSAEVKISPLSTDSIFKFIKMNLS